MKKILIILCVGLFLGACQKKQEKDSTRGRVEVFMTKKVSANGVLAAYRALNIKPMFQNPAVNLSLVEPNGGNYLPPTLLRKGIQASEGTIIASNIADKEHKKQWETIEQNEWMSIAEVDILDDKSDTALHQYDFLLNIAPFAQSTEYGFAGALLSIGYGIATEKEKNDVKAATNATQMIVEQAKKTQDFYQSRYRERRIAYINVMPDMVILASANPVALDKASLDYLEKYKKGTDSICRTKTQELIQQANEAAMGPTDYAMRSLDGQEMLALLNANNLSLVVRNKGRETMYSQSGVKDLYNLVTQTDLLNGASVADKIIGTGAAFLMIKGGVEDVTTNVVSQDAKELFEKNGVTITADSVVAMIENRAKTGECPLEKRLKGVQKIDEAMPIIAQFIADLNAGRAL